MSKSFVDGIVYVRKTRCETCIFRPGNLMDLEPGRVEGMIADADAAESAIPCHKHLYENADIEPVCKGYFDRKSSATLRLAEAVGIVERIDP
jgi:hypothetical protein